jgi:hypothetical protein
MTSARREKIVCLAIFVLCVALNLGLSRIGWSHNTREVHEFRQTQTALAARTIQREGWSLAGPLPLFGPPWSAPLEFPLYQTCVATFSTWTGQPLESAGRLVSLCFLYLSLPAFFLLLGHLAVPSPRRWLFLALMLVTPVYLYYSRAFMIESAALCAAAWFLHAYCCALETRRAAWVGAGIILGSLAGLIKVTTFVVFLFPAIALTLRQLWLARPQPGQSLRASWTIAGTALGVTLPPLAAALAWVAYGDAIKKSNPLSIFLASDHLHEWNYGTVALRIDPKFWQALWHHSSTSVLQTVGIGLFIVFTLLIGRGPRGRVVVLLLCFLTGPLLFGNLYFLHDYYFYATGVFLLAAVVLIWNELLNLTSIPLVLRWAVIVVTLAAQLFGFTHGYFRVQTRGDLEQPELGRILGAITHPADILLLHGFAWNPGIAYASDRKAIMVTDASAENPAELDEVLRRIPANSIGAWAITGHHRDDAAFTKPLIEKLGLQPEPVLRNDSVVVFIARRLVPTAIPRLERLRLSSFSLNLPPDAEIRGVKVRRYRVSDLPDSSEVEMFVPRPSQILAPFGISTAFVDRAHVLNAHAPTEITVPVSPASRKLKADFGILPDAYTGEKKTDGVVFRIELIAGNAPSSVLFEMHLTPATTPAHRGRQHLEITLPVGASGDMVFRTLPGPANDISFDWAYWTAVVIE